MKIRKYLFAMITVCLFFLGFTAYAGTIVKTRGMMEYNPTLIDLN